MRLSTNAVMLGLVVALGIWGVGPARSAEITVFQQTNVIQPVAGTEYLGPPPPELMEYGRVGVGVLTVSKQPEVAAAFIKFMADPANAALLRKGDMEAPLR